MESLHDSYQNWLDLELPHTCARAGSLHPIAPNQSLQPPGASFEHALPTVVRCPEWSSPSSPPVVSELSVAAP